MYLNDDTKGELDDITKFIYFNPHSCHPNTSHIYIYFSLLYKCMLSKPKGKVFSYKCYVLLSNVKMY